MAQNKLHVCYEIKRLIMKIISTIICLLLIANLGLFAENNPSSKGKIKGVVLNKKDNKPIEYATIALYNAKTGELIDGSISDYLGQFKINSPVIGEYYLSVKFLGFKEYKSQSFTVDGHDKNLHLGNFLLENASANLDEFEVVEKKAAIEYRIDKKVVNVDKQITAEGGTAVEILENVPSVQVDVEGNVSLRGSTSFTVLIDGKPTVLEASDALRQIPSSNIENIEIITNPSVKYDPDGATGIINIVTKKNYLDGLSGIVNGRVGTFDQYGANVLLNYRVNKFNFILGADYDKRPRPGTSVSNRETYVNDTTYYVNSEGDVDRHFERSTFRGGVEYNPTKNDYISLSGNFGRWDMDWTSQLAYEDYTNPETNLFEYNSLDNTTRGGDYYTMDAVYQHDFKKKTIERDTAKIKGKGMGNGRTTAKQGGGSPQGGKSASKIKQSSMFAAHNLKIEFNYRNRNSDESTINQLLDADNKIIGSNKTIENGPSDNLRFYLDYVRPLGKNAKLETGIQFRIGNSTDNTELWLYNTETADYEILPEFTNSTDYQRNIYAAYALGAGKLKNLGYQIGLRGEYTDRKISNSQNDNFELNRWDLFPTLHFSYDLPGDQQQFMISYTRRIHRPRGWQLEPFITWQDQYNVRQGDPDLKPEYIDSFEAGYINRIKDVFFSLEAYYRITNNMTERITTVYEGNVMLSTFQNIGKDYSLGLEAMLNFDLFKWWEISLSGNYYNYRIDGYLYEDRVDKTSNNWNSRFNNTFKITDNLSFQLTSRYNSASVTSQGERTAVYTMDAAVKWSLFDKKLSISAQGRDLLGTAQRERTASGTDFYSYYKYYPRRPSASLTLTYRFNNFKMKRNSRDSGGSEEDF